MIFRLNGGTGMLVVSFRDVNYKFWYHLGCARHQ